VTIPPNRLVVLDTTVLVHLARNDATGKTIEQEYELAARPERPLISTITEGEVLGLARYWRWGKDKMDRLREIMSELVRVNPSHTAILDAYATFYAEGRSKGLSCGENDLWIAATAKATDAVLITCDLDFDWLSRAGHIARIYVPESK
jgi:predicted nucleic acid-binding protein